MVFPDLGVPHGLECQGGLPVARKTQNQTDARLAEAVKDFSESWSFHVAMLTVGGYLLSGGIWITQSNLFSEEIKMKQILHVNILQPKWTSFVFFIISSSNSECATVVAF